jgi:hypothetical protein
MVPAFPQRCILASLGLYLTRIVSQYIFQLDCCFTKTASALMLCVDLVMKYDVLVEFLYPG